MNPELELLVQEKIDAAEAAGVPVPVEEIKAFILQWEEDNPAKVDPLEEADPNVGTDLAKVQDPDYTEQTGIKKQNASIWDDISDWWKISEDETQEEPTLIEQIPSKIGLGGTFVEDWFSKNQFTDLLGDQWRMIENSWHGAGSHEEMLQTYATEKYSDLTEEQQADLYEAMEAQTKTPMSDEMREFQRTVSKEENSKQFNWLDALTDGTLAENPSLAWEVAAGSAIGMGSAILRSEEVRKDVAQTTAVTTAAGVGAGAVAGTIGGPFAEVTVPAGMLAFGTRGFFAGLFGSVSGAIETSTTFGDQVRKEVEAAELEWNEENMNKVLNDPEAFERIRNKAFTKGATVEGIDMIANAVAPGVGSAILRGGGSKVAAGAATLTIDALSGAGGEYVSSKAIGEEASRKDLILEAAGEFGGSGPVNVIQAIKNPTTYKINGKEASGKDVASLLNDENISDEELANTDIEINNNDDLNAKYSKRLNKANLRAQVDPRVNQQEDVETIIKLEEQLQALDGRKSQSAKDQSSELKKNIQDITNQYKPGGEKFVDARTSEVRSRKKAAESVKEGVADKVFERGLDFAKKHAAIYGLEVDSSMSPEEIQAYVLEQGGTESDANDSVLSDGFILGDKIVINKAVAKATGAVNVGNHELLHGILRKAMKEGKITEDVVSGLKETIGAEQWASVQQRADANYTPEYLQANPDEWLTLTSDAIREGDITYNESMFQPLKDLILPILRKFGFSKINFETGEDAFNFLKEYNRSIHKGALSTGIVKATGGKERTEGVKFSQSARAGVNELAEDQTNKSWRKGGGDAAIKSLKDNGTFDALIASKYKVRPIPKDFVDKVYSELTPYIKRFKPEQNDNLFAYINAQVANKAGTVYNREYKVTQRTQDIDAKTTEGASTIQVAAETEADVKSFEEQDLSIPGRKKRAKQQELDQSSKFRREIGLDDKLVKKVRDTVVKTFGTKLPNVESKKFKAALQKAYRTELKKPIQDMIGKGETYDTFLADKFPSVYKFLPKETLLQMERNVAPENRVFTKSERITKPTEVDRLISEGLLPKNTNRLSGPTLITKLPYPGSKKVNAYFRGKDMESTLGYKVGASTLGTRKDKLAMEMGVELGFDATMETVQQSDVAGRLQDIEDLQGYKRIENHNAILAKQIDRDPSIKFSKTLKKGIIESGLSIDEGANILRNERMHVIDVQYPSLHDALVELYEDTYKPTDYTNIQFLGQVSRGVPELESFIKNKGHQTRKKVGGEYVFDVVGLKNHFNNYSTGVLDFMPQKIGDIEQNAKGNYKILENGVFKGNSARGNGGETLSIRTKRRDAFREKVANDMGSSVTPRAEKAWNEFFKVADNLELAESTFDGPETLLREIKKIQSRDMTAKDKVKLAQKTFNPKSLDAAQKLFTAYNISIEDWVNSQVESEAMTRVEAVEYVLRDKQKNTNFNKGERAMAAFTSVYFVDGPQSVTKQKGEHVKDSATISAATTISIYNGTFASDAASILNGFEQSLVPKSLADEMDVLGGANSPLGNRRFILNPKIGKNVYDLASGKSMYDLELEKFTKEQAEAFGSVYSNVKNDAKIFDKAVIKFSKSSKPKGISVLDFDDTLATTKSNVLYTLPDGTTGKLTAEEFAKKGGDLISQGVEFDFSEFNKVVKGKTAPLFNKALKLAKKFGTDNMFILTARAPESQVAIKEFLDANGLNIPLKNITGLGKSEASAKAMWIAERVGEGYNDFYFADDAIQNVKAVKDMLDRFDVKGKVQQAKLKFSKTAPKTMSDIIDEGAIDLDSDLNIILEQTKGVGRQKRFSPAKARKRGKNKGKFKFFIPPSADDFAGLMYSFMGKGKIGDKHHKWFKENLFDPFSKGVRHLNNVKQAVANDMRQLRKAMPDVRKKLGSKIADTDYTHEDAIRVYNWDKAGFEVPGLSKTDSKRLLDAVNNDPELLAFADAVNSVGNQPAGGIVEPGDHWLGGTIASDMTDALNNARATYLQQWKENADIIFNEANMNKIEAVYGSNFREALEDSLFRMEHGGNKSRGGGRLLNNFTNWIHGSIGTTMFFNARSAVLQMISNVNFINWSDNSVLQAAKAFANQKQYWSDVAMIFNSPFLKQRRAGIQTDVNASELLAQIKDSKNKAKAATAYLLQLGFTPTQIADSFAIATGGATMYRNRTKTYLNEGMSKKDAETKAFEDMMEIAEETQQSAREDRISQQQASPLGKFILAFQNTPMQYNRLIKKAVQDLVNNRGDWRSNVSKIVYYGAIQNMIFYGLQQALFATLFGDDEEDELTDKKKERIINGMMDTLLRGSGIGGAVVSTIKNVMMKFAKESEKIEDGLFYTDPDWGNVVIEGLNISPPIGIKARKVYSGLKTWEYNKDVIDLMDKTDIDNPIYDAVSSGTEAVTNLPVNRLYNKYQNVSEAMDSDNESWQRVAMLLGWSRWNFGIENQDVMTAKGEVKRLKEKSKEEKKEIKKQERAAEKAAEKAAVQQGFIEDQEKERKEGEKDITCAAVNKSGTRCGKKVEGKGNFCTIHEKVPQSSKEVQCSHVKANGDRCKMKTKNESGKCYYHD